MAASATRHFDPPTSHEPYRLELVDWDEDKPVIIRAILTKNGQEDDSSVKDLTFNLSDNIGLDPRNKLVWGLSGFELLAKGVKIQKIEGSRHIVVELKEGGEPRALNLDNYLGLVEYYDEKSGEIGKKLGKKPESSKRSIILCFDGTSHHFSNRNTNVVKLVELLKKDDPSKQVVYYQSGVGTYSSPGFLTNFGQKIAASADTAVAWYLYQHIIDGYRYLMQTYKAGDQISIFGFSRGGYTARALAGMLHTVGLLPMHNMEQLPFAYQIYKEAKETIKTKDKEDPGQPEFTTDPKHIHPEAFKRTFCTPVIITFLGVWDSVGSVGTFSVETLPYIHHNPSIIYFRQALALDENRGNFIPSVWDHSKTDPWQSALEVWFKGSHTDVGGGSDPPENFIPDNALDHDLKPVHRLSNITLRWMKRQCHSPGVKILFDPKAMHRFRQYGVIAKRIPGDDDEDFENAIAKLDKEDVILEPNVVQDHWSLAGLGWWFLDKLPVPKTSQELTPGSEPGNSWMPNNGAARVINCLKKNSPIRLHSSVYTHLQNHADKGGKKGEKYLPAAEWRGWQENEWPEIEGGNMRSIMLPQDKSSALVRDALMMSWKPKPEPKGMLSRAKDAVSGVFKSIFG